MVFSVCIKKSSPCQLQSNLDICSATYPLLIGLVLLCTRPDRKLQNICFCSVVFLGVAVLKHRYLCEPLESVWKIIKSSTILCIAVWFCSSMSLSSAKLAYLPVLALFFKNLQRWWIQTFEGARQWWVARSPAAIWEIPIKYEEMTNIGRDCLEGMWNLHPWRYLNLDWTSSCAVWCSCICFEQ